MKKLTVLLLFMFCISMSASVVFADGDSGTGSEVKEGLYLNTNLGASINQLGLALKADLFYRFPLINKPGKLWKDTKIEVGVQEYFSPSFQRASAYCMIAPIAVFDVKAYVGYDYMYDLDGDTFGPGYIPRSGPDDDYDTDDRKGAPSIAKGGFRMLVIPTFKMALGPVAALYSINIEYHNYNEDGYYYDPSTFIIHKSEDTSLKHDAKLLYRTKTFGNIGKFMFGVNYTNLWVRSSEKTSQKLAGMVVYQPSWSVLSPNLKPYFVTMLGSHLQDRYYKGKFYFALLMGLTYKIY